MPVTRYRIVGTRQGKLIALGRSHRNGRFTDGQVYYVPADSDRAHSGYTSEFHLLKLDLDYERAKNPDWNWKVQKATWTESEGTSPWEDAEDSVLNGSP